MNDFITTTSPLALGGQHSFATGLSAQDLDQVLACSHPDDPPLGGQQVSDATEEYAAALLWNRFASTAVEDWENETHKAEYRLAAKDVLALVSTTPTPTAPVEASGSEREAARDWLRKRWSQDHPNEGHVKQLADYAVHLAALKSTTTKEAEPETTMPKLMAMSPEERVDALIRVIRNTMSVSYRNGITAQYVEDTDFLTALEDQDADILREIFSDSLT